MSFFSASPKLPTEFFRQSRFLLNHPISYIGRMSSVISIGRVQKAISMKHFIKKDDLVTRCIAGETIIVPVRGNVGDMDSIFTLNEVGTLVWELIDGQTSVSQIVVAICNECDVAQEEAEKDVIELLGSLEAAGLIHTYEESKG